MIQKLSVTDANVYTSRPHLRMAARPPGLSGRSI